MRRALRLAAWNVGLALAALVTTHRLGKSGDPVFGRLHDLAEARGIPVISQCAWIERQGGDVRDARWPHDPHRSPTGHRWAGEPRSNIWHRTRMSVTGSCDKMPPPAR